MANTHLLPETIHEVMARDYDLLAPAILGSTLAAAGWAGMTIGPFTTFGYVKRGSPGQLVYVNQAAAGVTLTGSDGAYWLAIHHDTHSAVAGWTRVAGTHYLWRANATQPADPPGGLVLAGVTVASSAISAVDASLNYPAQKIAFGAGTGQLAFDTNLRWDGSTLRVEGTTQSRRFVVPNYALDNAIAFQTDFMAGVNRWAIYASGTAPSFLGGELRVTGALTVLGATGLGGNAAAGYTLFTYGHSSLAGNVGIGLASDPATAMLDVNGTVRVRSGATINTNLQVDGTVGINSWLSIGGTLGVLGTSHLAGATGIGGAPNAAQGVLRVYGNTYAGGTIAATGNVAVASTNTGLFQLFVNGSAGKPGGGGFSDSSSRHLKRDITDIDDALGLLLAQRGRCYEWEEPEHARVLPGPQHGFVYDEVTIDQWKDTGPQGEALLTLRGAEALFVEALRQVVTRLEHLEGHA